jgi:AAA+ ATPase superfamily predicted ATPase
MRFIDRADEMTRLDHLMARSSGGLAVVWGRRRIGKTRLLLEWSDRHGGLYTVADQSSASIQLRYFAEAVSQRIPGFADVDYRDWRGLLVRLAKEASLIDWRGPIIFDELPYLVLSSPELPSVLQHWVDHEAAAANLVVSVAGSSQRMMQGIVLNRAAPLYGRAHEALELQPIAPGFLWQAMRPTSIIELVELYAAWGGVPRYWELAAELEMDTETSINHLVLDPLGPLHQEPDRILIEEIPSALEVRPVLDAIGSGAHRVSEIAGRIGRPATSMSRPLDRLIEMDLVKREIPFSEPEKRCKRSLYKISDPFFRLWFRVVAAHRGQLAAGNQSDRQRVLKHYWGELLAIAWEEICRQQVSQAAFSALSGDSWVPAMRWWKGNHPEWDVVSQSADGSRLLLGEVKWSQKPLKRSVIDRALQQLHSRRPPLLAKQYQSAEEIRILFVPELAEADVTTIRDDNLAVVCGSELIPP